MELPLQEKIKLMQIKGKQLGHCPCHTKKPCPCDMWEKFQLCGCANARSL